LRQPHGCIIKNYCLTLREYNIHINHLNYINMTNLNDKKSYQPAELEVIHVASADIICTSSSIQNLIEDDEEI